MKVECDLVDIMVIRRSKLFDDNAPAFDGFLKGGEVYERRINAYHEYQPRPEMETDPKFKQPIPYAVVYDVATRKVLAYRRGKGGEERRLHDKWSIGFGGHVEPSDRTILSCLWRELNEELDFHAATMLLSPEPFGVINDDKDDVGKVHFGIAYIIKVYTEVTGRDKDHEDLKWVDIDTTIDVYDRLEPWSKMVFDALISESGGQSDVDSSSASVSRSEPAGEVQGYDDSDGEDLC